MFDNIQLFPCRKFDSNIFCCVLHIAGEIVLFVKNVSCRNTWGNIRRLLIIISNYRLSIIIGNFGSSRLDQKMNRNYTLGHSVTWKFELYLVLIFIEFLLNFANLNFNFNYNLVIAEISFTLHYQPSGAGGTCSPPATPNRLPVGPKMADGVWKGVF